MSKNTELNQVKILNNGKQVLTNNDRSRNLPYGTEAEKENTDRYLEEEKENGKD